jgi:hypothetical protein
MAAAAEGVNGANANAMNIVVPHVPQFLPPAVSPADSAQGYGFGNNRVPKRRRRDSQGIHISTTVHTQMHVLCHGLLVLICLMYPFV